MKYIITTKSDYKSEPIEATSKEDAIATFAVIMDSNMTNYFEAIPVKEKENSTNA